MINSDDKVGDGMSDYEKVKDSAENYDKYFNDLGIFEECAICGYEGPRDGLIYLSTLSNDGKDLCISSGLQHLYQNVISEFETSPHQFDHNYANAIKSEINEFGMVKQNKCICNVCYKTMLGTKILKYNIDNKTKVPERAYLNGLFPGEIPKELMNLTKVEISMISIFNCITKISYKNSKYAIKVAKTYTIVNDLTRIASQLPHMPSLNDFAIMKYVNDDVKDKELKYRPKRVFEALQWLKKNNRLYKDIDIIYPKGWDNELDEELDIADSFFELNEEEHNSATYYDNIEENENAANSSSNTGILLKNILYIILFLYNLC
jgi:hypothetical protein